MESTLISVIIPVFNTLKDCLEKCIDSVLAQSYENIEIIIVDDGSNIDTATWLDIKAVCDSRIYVIHKKNAGVSVARNTGIKIAKGEYITFIDSDDYVEQYFLEQSLDYIRIYQLDIITGQTYKVNGEKIQKLEKIQNSQIQLIDTVPAMLEAVLLNYTKVNNTLIKIIQAPWCKVFKASVIGDNRFPNGLKYGEDAVFNAKVFASAQKVGVVTEHWYNYVTNDFSTMSIRDERKMVQYLDQHIQYINQIVLWGQMSGNADITLISYKKAVNIFNDVLKFYITNCKSKFAKGTKSKLNEVLCCESLQYAVCQLDMAKSLLSIKERLNVYICKKQCLGLLLVKQRLTRLLKSF